MKENLLSTIYFFSKIPLISQSFRLFYWYNALMASFLLNKKEHKLVAIKGGYARGDYKLIISDIDFVVTSLSFKKPKLINFLCPLVKDIDVYTPSELTERLKYGGFKYSDASNWKVKKGTLPDVNYLYYPAKIRYDVIEEIYFYYEWIFENTKLSFSSYRKACLLRNLKKVRSLLPLIISNGEHLADINSINLDKITEIKDYISFFVKVVGFIRCEESVEATEYIKENFVLNESLPEEFSKVYLNQHMLNVFYSNGAIDTYYIYKNLINGENKILNHMQVMRYYFKLLDGKTNHIHDSVKDISIKEKVENATETLKNFNVFNFNGLYHGKVVFITASWGNDYLNRLLEAHKQNLNKLGHAVDYIHVSLGGDERFFADVDSVTTIRIENLTSFKGLWHKESLFNIAIDFVQNAESYIFSDIDAVIPDAGWLLKLKDRLQNFEAIQPFKTFIDEKTKEETYSSIAAIDLNEEAFYAPGLIWAFNQAGLKKLGKLCDSFHDGSNDGVLFKEITNTQMGLIEKLDWTAKKLERELSDNKYNYSYLDYQLSHISHPLPKHYINMILFFNMILPLIDRSLVRSDYGLWSWKLDVDSKLQLLFSQFRKDRGFCDVAFLNALKPFLNDVLVNKTQKYLFYLDEEKKISMASGKGELALFIGNELKDLQLYFATLHEKIETVFHHHLENFEKDNSYSISFVFESEENLAESLKINISRLKLMEMEYFCVNTNKNLWYLTINFYAWQEIESPLLELVLSMKNDSVINFNSYQISKLNQDKDWEWFYEKKEKTHQKTRLHQINLKNDFPPKWYKAVLKLSDHELEKYRFSLVDSNKMNIYLPRIQEDADNYIDFYFKPTVGCEFINLVIETDMECEFFYDLVIYH